MNHHDKQTEPSVLDPVRELKIAGEILKVKELSWPAALKFLGMMSKQAAAFMTPEGKLEFQLDKLSDLIIQVTELSNHLITASTGKDEKWLETISFSDACDVLDLALTMNLNDEIIGKAKKVVGRFAQGLGVKTAKALTNQSAPV